MAVGIDIVFIPRIKDESLFAHGILSTNELKIYEKRNDKKVCLAGRFAAKEAFFKARKTGIDQSLKNVEVLYDDNNAPYILYKENKYEVSISHDGDYAIAIVILWLNTLVD